MSHGKSTLRRMYHRLSQTNQSKWTRWQLIKLSHYVRGEDSNSKSHSNRSWRTTINREQRSQPSQRAPFKLKGRYGFADTLIQSGESVLEVGCGRGEYLHHLQTQGTRVLGVDHSDKALETASEIGVPLQSHDLMSDDPLPSGYNVVLCLQVLELFKDPWEIYKKL